MASRRDAFQVFRSASLRSWHWQNCVAGPESEFQAHELRQRAIASICWPASSCSWLYRALFPRNGSDCTPKAWGRSSALSMKDPGPDDVVVVVDGNRVTWTLQASGEALPPLQKPGLAAKVRGCGRTSARTCMKVTLCEGARRSFPKAPSQAVRPTRKAEYRGVLVHANKFSARTCPFNENVPMGSFSTAEDAAIAFDHFVIAQVPRDSMQGSLGSSRCPFAPLLQPSANMPRYQAAAVVTPPFLRPRPRSTVSMRPSRLGSTSPRSGRPQARGRRLHPRHTHTSASSPSFRGALPRRATRRPLLQCSGFSTR